MKINKKYLFFQSAFFALFHLFFSASAVAADDFWSEEGLSKQYLTCINKDALQSTQGQVECIVTEYKIQDKRLNQAYQAIQKMLNDKRRGELLNSQRLWIKFRDADCNYYANVDGGTIARIYSNKCMMLLTARRARELEQMSEP